MAGHDTPMMRQYRSIKNSLAEDTVLFYRLGDFYEMFFEDARVTAEALDITLTKRNKMPMCGIPYHQLEPYLAKMMRAGYKVAICEQVEDPADAKGIVRREVTRVVTPGTLIEEHVLEAARNNYLAGLARHGATYGMALLDLSTGEFWIEETDRAEWMRDALLQVAPAECILPEEQEEALRPLLGGLDAGLVSCQEDWIFEPDVAIDTLTRHFRVQTLDGFGCGACSAGLQAAGGVLYYVTRTLRRDSAHVRGLRVRNPEEYLLLDESTIANLDLLPRRPPGRSAADPNLLQVLDATRTAMGARLLRAWLLRPLRGLDAIRARHDAVEALVRDRSALAGLRDLLGGVKDLERLLTRLGGGGANARDALGLGRSLERIGPLREALAPFDAPLPRELAEAARPLPELTKRILEAIEEEPPVLVREGGIIRKGVHPELDDLREAATEGRRWLAEFQAAEQERTGIKSLKVRHNKVFGYYIEITKSNLASAPDHYIRKQTLVNAERFITPELKEYENKILGAQDRAKDLEYELFQDIRRAIVEETAAIQETASAVAALDVLSTLAERALSLRYTRPEMDDGGAIRIDDGRHPIIEQMPESDRFVPNDTVLDRTENQVLIITGPNMAGKSTYIRQVALIAILAQMGSFVPAARAKLGVVDRVFTRVGASDDLARGRSTFMVEMQETANILNNATAHSLVILDEIGRGTSTFDGISIAWAVAEHLHNHPEVKAKTLFATHYHELTDLAVTLPGVKNYCVMVRESGDKIVFLRKIAPGAADKSYGIQVARLAGLPARVIERAGEILANLEDGEYEEDRQPALARRRPRKGKDHPDQLALF